MSKVLSYETRVEARKLGFNKSYSGTQSDLQDWLREDKNIIVEVITVCTGKFLNDKIIYCYKPSITVLTPIPDICLFFTQTQVNLFEGKLPLGFDYEAPMGYDEALYYGLKEGLKLIKES